MVFYICIRFFHYKIFNLARRYFTLKQIANNSGPKCQPSFQEPRSNLICLRDRVLKAANPEPKNALIIVHNNIVFKFLAIPCKSLILLSISSLQSIRQIQQFITKDNNQIVAQKRIAKQKKNDNLHHYNNKAQTSKLKQLIQYSY